MFVKRENNKMTLELSIILIIIVIIIYIIAIKIYSVLLQITGLPENIANYQGFLYLQIVVILLLKVKH